MTGIIIAFPKAENAKNIKGILVRNGFKVLAMATSGGQVLKDAEDIGRGIVICSYRLPDMMYWELKECLPQDFDMIVIASPAQLAQGQSGDIVSLSTPLKVHELLSTVETAVYNAERKHKRKKNVPRKRSQQEQELINEAKTLLMNKKGMSEDEAHKYLQKTSMDNGTSFTETAHMILSLMDH